MKRANASPSKERLLHLLAEASELEHDLLCSYLFALFSLKDSVDEDLTPAEKSVLDAWREDLVGVCMEEMGHLAQIANLSVSIGCRPHLNRPNLPVAAGYHPASVVVELSRFDHDTLCHFAFLERPTGDPTPDGSSFEEAQPYQRRTHYGNLMPSAPNYETIGEFYEVLKSELQRYADEAGEAALFSGPTEQQMHPDELHMDALRVVENLADALAAVDEIVEQGEGASLSSDESHFVLFCRMRDQHAELAGRRSGFAASREVGRNPVMHAPVTDHRTHVTEPAASRTLDAANASYGLMLRCLARCFETPRSQQGARRWLLDACVGAMKAMKALGCALTLMDATADSRVKAGMSFAMLRSMEGWQGEADALTELSQRAGEILLAVQDLPLNSKVIQQVGDALACSQDLKPT